MDEITRALKLARAHYNDSTVDILSLNYSKEYRCDHYYIDDVAHALRIGRRVDSHRAMGDFEHSQGDMTFIKSAEIIWKKRY
jgi:hypothetical protein